MGRLGGRGSEEEEAAAVAALVAGADPDKALADAATLFRCLRASRLVAADLAGSGLKGPSASPSAATATSAEELAAKTEKATLGEVTCFLSHSWRDEDEAPGAKYEAFERWAQEHKEKTGEEATVWLVRARSARLPAGCWLTPFAAPRRTRRASTRTTSTRRWPACRSSSRAARRCSSRRGRPTAPGSGCAAAPPARTALAA